MNYYWYQSDPSLYAAEVQMMNRQFPQFQIGQLQDGSGRLYWRGKVQPCGSNGIVWDLMLIYKNDHPHAGQNEYGGSVQILPISPRLKNLGEQLLPQAIKKYGSYDNALAHGFGLGLPHVYHENFGRNDEYFICTADPKYFKTGQTHSTSAASALAWACKWCYLFEGWINGEIGDELAMEGNY